MTNLPTKLLNDNAVIPTYGSDSAAGMDLYAAFAETIPAGQHRIVKTGIAMKIPDGFYGRIAPRSGLAYKNGIDVFAGVIDNDYRGEIGIILYNATATKGAFFSFVVVMAIGQAAEYLVISVFSAAIFETLIGQLIAAIFSAVYGLIGVSVLTTLYGHYVEGREL